MNETPSPGRKARDLIAAGETIIIPGAHDPLMGRILQRMGPPRLLRTCGDRRSGGGTGIPFIPAERSFRKENI